MKNKKNVLLSIALLIALTFVLTYPLVVNMGSSVKDLGDPLIAMWVLSWNFKVITHFEFQLYFDANIFFPHKRTLAYSDPLFVQSIIAAPAFMISKNPIFAYNFTLLFSLFTSALGMFLLARYLTNSCLAGVFAGIVYAFSPFMISHLGHLQLTAAGGIPLAFLFLHKFFKQERYRDLLLFALFFIIQVLINGYYAMYLGLFVGFYIMVFIIIKNKFRDRHFWVKMAVLLFILIIVVGPFIRQYLLVVEEMGFLREKVSGARFSNYLSTMPNNLIYGDITRKFFRVEGQLFPGIIAFLLAVFGIIYGSEKRKNKLPFVQRYIFIYSAILFSSFLFSFGLKGPYWILYRFIPGFKGLRVANRFHIMVMFSLAILAAYGIKKIFWFFKKKRKYFIISVLIILLLIEYWSAPIHFVKIPKKEKIPEVYKSLRELEENVSIIELPILFAQPKHTHIESLRMYYSTFHWKRMVNGRSSFFPPLYIEISRRWNKYHNQQFVNDLKMLDVDYMIIHAHLINKKKMNLIISRFSTYIDDIQFLKKIGESYIYKLKHREDMGAGKKIRKTNQIVPKSDWRVFANINNNRANLAHDNDYTTAWKSGPQRKGYYFKIDLGKICFIRALRLRLAHDQPFSHPDRFFVILSVNGVEWEKIAEGKGIIVPITEYLTPKKVSFVVDFESRKARYIQVVNLRNQKKKEWTISEIDIFE